VPVLAVWDDHDYGANDAGAEYPMKAESQRMFLDFFGVAGDSPRRRRPGIYDARVFGPPGRRVQVILLDLRYFRSPFAGRMSAGRRGRWATAPTPRPRPPTRRCSARRSGNGWPGSSRCRPRCA
jgi:alkaline phosphatase D